MPECKALFGEITQGGLERWNLPQPVGTGQDSHSASATPAPGLDQWLRPLQAFHEDIFILSLMHFNVFCSFKLS